MYLCKNMLFLRKYADDCMINLDYAFQVDMAKNKALLSYTPMI